MKKTVGMGLLGSRLDRGNSPGRWEGWRPTVSLFQHEDLLLDRYHLLTEAGHRDLADQVAADIALVSPETEVRVEEIAFGRDAWDLANVYGALFDWARGQDFHSGDDHLIHITTGTHVAQISLFLLNEAGYLPGRLVQTAPPFGKARRGQPRVGRYSFIDLDLSRYDELTSRFAKEQIASTDFLKSGIATRNEGFNRLIARIEQVALRSRAPVLLTGPTGAGKSHLARRIYELRRSRANLAGDFVEVNCATLGGDTAASTLFGHRKGAFTGAQSHRPGLLRTADGGMLFLDEIGELGRDEQAMLLRALEEKTFLPVGADAPVRSDFQLIAGTNRDLGRAVAEGRFREDLLARIQLWTFALPALAERREDLAPNLDFELARLSEQEGRRVSFNKEAREAFLRFAESPDTPWRGNFRDLNAALTRMSTLAPRGRIRVEEVEEEIARLRASWHRPGENAAALGVDLTHYFPAAQLAEIDPFDRVQLAHVIAVCQRSPSLSAAGRELFAVSRLRRAKPNDCDRLKKYLAKWGLSWPVREK
ncbi:RNA repair transcriptional activator RtcR [Roseibacillus ishigakijimensis]|uniref:Sigma 54-interacting transcriptional regulator n=1 Tax=Roseibacillus ishigakijimensis TaxID=454146 RepID=A0A934RR81_9BACT|nr:RNA repair transcriptional activator RtcR [Roseibacillus ishigakijimensis]MBK1833574.1 sigma 54-interacting transcriptional regulator [Roseibacillus ishigakijimensis]